MVEIKDAPFYAIKQACVSWAKENATDDYEYIEYNNSLYDKGEVYRIHRLIFRFKNTSDAIMFKLSDPMSIDDTDVLF